MKRFANAPRALNTDWKLSYPNGEPFRASVINERVATIALIIGLYNGIAKPGFCNECPEQEDGDGRVPVHL